MIGRHRALGEDMIRVLVAENSRIHSRLLADALKSDPLLEVTPFESESSGLVAAIIAEDIDVLVISCTLDELPSRGIEILQELRNLHRETRSVMLLASSKDEIVLKAFRAGARGLFSKNDPLEHLSECVRAVYQGKVWANDHAIGVAVDALAASPSVRASNANGMKLLSKRELQVVRSLAEGLTNREIAEQLNLSPHTIKNYLFRIFDKLGVSSRIELLFMTLSQNEAVPSLPSPTSQNGQQLNIPTAKWPCSKNRQRPDFPRPSLLWHRCTSFAVAILRISFLPTCGTWLPQNAPCSPACS